MDDIMTSTTAPPPIETVRPPVGIVGAGVMGRGLAQAVATHGQNVILVDLNETILRQAIEQIARTVRAQTLMGAATGASAAGVVARISLSTELGALAPCDFVIENVVEKTDAKESVYNLLGRTVAPDTILAANTSTFPVAEIASFTSHPERVIGLHFMNPAQTKPFVEVIPGAATAARTLQRALEFLGSIDKTGIVVADAPGFVSNRVLMLTINEAIRTVEERTAGATDVDRIFVSCFGHAMGPLATADLIGLDTILMSLESLRTRLHDPKYQPADLLCRLVAANKLGRKTGQGFFSYGGH